MYSSVNLRYTLLAGFELAHRHSSFGAERQPSDGLPNGNTGRKTWRVGTSETWGMLLIPSNSS